MGKSGSGKTSMRSIIFANYIARETRRLGATIDVEHSHVRCVKEQTSAHPQDEEPSCLLLVWTEQ